MGLKEEEKELGIYNPSKEWDEYEIGQNTTTMKTITRKSSSVVTNVILKL
jgi:hypothetical protein